MTRALWLTLLLAASPALAEKTLAITAFEVNGGGADFAPLGKGLAEMLISDLSVLKSVTLVERARLNAVMDELKLSKSPYIDPATAVKLGKGLAASHLLAGSITVLQNKVSIEAHVFEVQTSRVLQGKKVQGESAEFFALEKELVDLLIDSLEVKPDLKEKSALRKSATESFDAIRGYSQGLDALDKGDKASAQAHFAKATEADPQWPALKKAFESLTKELDALDAQRAGDLDAQVKALRPADPKLYEKIEALAEPRHGPPDEREAAQMQVMTAVMKAGLKPSKPTYAGHKVGATPVAFWETRETADTLGIWGDEPQTIAVAPCVLEYFVNKYPEDATWLEREAPALWKRLSQRLEKTDLSKPAPEIPGSGDNVERRKRWLAWFNAFAKDVPLAGPREPKACLQRVQGLLEKEKVRRAKELEEELRKRFAALDAKADRKALTLQVDDLVNAIEAQDEDRAWQMRKRIQLVRWMVDHPGAKPMHGTEKDPVWLEVSMLQQMEVRYDDDPECWELIPPMGEYLLKKYPNAPYLSSQLRLWLKHIDEARKDLAGAKRRWADKQRDPELTLGPEIRDLFRRAGEAGRKWRAQ